MAKMTKNQLIDAIVEGTQVSKGDVKAVIEQMATAGHPKRLFQHYRRKAVIRQNGEVS